MNFTSSRSLAAMAATLALTACGGGGGSDDPQLGTADLQGYWTGPITGTALGEATRARAVVLEDGRAWIFLHDGSQPSEPLLGLATAALTTGQETFAGTGKRYPASGVPVADITVSGGSPSATTMTVSVQSGGASGSAALTYSDSYDVPAAQADVVGTWGFTKEGGSIVANWTVAADGTLTGSSTLGCSYDGSVRPRNATTAIFAVALTETCTGTTKQLSGVGRLNADRSFLTFGLTTTAGAEAEAFVAAKQQ